MFFDDNKKESLPKRHPAVFCPAVVVYSGLPVSFLPLRESEISKWAKIQLERNGNTFVSSCAYLKIGDEILAAGTSAVVPPGVRVTFPHLLAVWHNYRFGEPASPAVYLFCSDSFSTVVSVNRTGVRGYYKVAPERTRDALYEAIMLARRQEGGDRLKVYSNVSIEGAEQIDPAGIIRELPRTAFIDTRGFADRIRGFFEEHPVLAGKILSVLLGVLIALNLGLGLVNVKKAEELSRKQALRVSLMSLRSVVGDLTPLNHRCSDLFSPDYRLPLQLTGLEVTSKGCTVDAKLYAFTSVRAKELLSCVEQEGTHRVSREGDWYVISWRVTNPEKVFDCFKNLEETVLASHPVSPSDGVGRVSGVQAQQSQQKTEGNRTKAGSGTELPDVKAQTDRTGPFSGWSLFHGYAYAAGLDSHQDGSHKKGRGEPLRGDGGVRERNLSVPAGTSQGGTPGKGNSAQGQKAPGGSDPHAKRDLLRDDRETWLRDELRRLERKLGKDAGQMPPGTPPAPSPSVLQAEVPLLKKRVFSNPGGFRISVVAGSGDLFVLTNGSETLVLSPEDTFSYRDSAFRIKKWSRNPLMVVLEDEDGTERIVFTSLSAETRTETPVFPKGQPASSSRPETREKQKVESEKREEPKSTLPPGINFPPRAR